jgi:cyclic-di-GMP-binding protein
MPSFDIVSEVDLQEVDNAVNQATKEIGQRYDFKGSKCAITLSEKKLEVVGDDDYKLKATVDVLQGKLVKRGVPIDNLNYGKVEPAAGSTVKQDIDIQVGVPTEAAKKIVKHIKDTKIKVQASIQGDSVRVSGKNRDDLQSVIQLLKENNFGLELQYTNFRD